MCLVSYIPVEDGFFLSSNRDESPLRDTSKVSSEHVGEQMLYFPEDHKGGSWIITSDGGKMVCLLNGAFDYHQHSPPYRMSRGVMCKKYFGYKDATYFFELFDFWGIEPFTMLIYEGKGAFYELRWDGQVKHVQELNTNKQYVWSSATLYTSEVQKIRAQVLLDFLEGQDLNDHKLIMEAHLQVFEEDHEKSLLINRENIVKTISHTQIRRSNQETQLNYYNLLSEDKSAIVI